MGRPQYPQYNQSAYSQFQPGTFFAGGRINARPQQTRGFTGLNYRDALQDRNRPAFARPGSGGMGPSAEEVAMATTNAGMMYNPNRGGLVPDTLYNRTTGYGSQRNPYSSRTMMQYDEGEGPQQPAMTEPQQRWAQKAQEKMSGAGALNKVTEKLSSALQGSAAPGFAPMGAGFSAGMQAVGEALKAAQTPAIGSTNPYLGTREQNIANAKAAGEFEGVRNKYNEANKGGSLRMDEAGNITQDPVALAKIKDEERRLNRGETLDTQKRGGITFRNLTSPYGSGSSRIVKGKADLMSKTPSTVRDDFGRIIPMNQYLERKKYVQGTKGMA